jgi:signal peptidase I
MTVSAIAPSAPAPDADGQADDRYSIGVLLAGILGRTWLWFVGACILITFVPMLFGWHPFVVKSGSMEPRIHIGDVVLAAPGTATQDLVGRVAVFTDPAAPSRTKTHRIVAVNADGTLQTKGDANPTPDSASVPTSDVLGLGRLVVRAAGLPLVWVQTGQWLWVLLFLASLVLAAYAVSRDDEDEPVDGPDDDSDPPAGDLAPMPVRLSESGSSAVAASSPLPPGTSSPAPAPTRPATSARDRWLWRIALACAVSVAFVLPTTGAAFSASTKSPTNAWAAGTWKYAASVAALNPWLYWNLDDTTGTVAADASGNGRTGTYNTSGTASAAGFTRGVTGGLTANSPNIGVTLNGTTACINTASSTTMNAPASITEVVWFRTTTTNGGKLLGFEMPQTGVAVAGSGGTYDRHIYMDGAGKVWFGVYNGGYFTISSPTALNDGTWHMAAATLGSAGMALWIDGVKVGTNANKVGESTTGWFRAGCGNLAGWGGSWTGANSPTTSTTPTQDRPFAGSLDEISIWQSALSAAQITSLWAAH